MTNTKRTNKILSWLLSLAMIMTVLPMSAFAADESTVITITNDNVNDASDAYLVDDSTLLLGGGIGMGGTHSFVLGPNPDGSAFTFYGVQIGGFSTVQGGKAVFKHISNTGAISDGSFDPESSGGLFVENRDTGDISGGTFNGNQEYSLTVENYGIISGGTFYGEVANVGTISAGTITGKVYNDDTGTITGGTFSGDVSNHGTISDGTFNGLVTNYGTITGGTFNGKILNMGGTLPENVQGEVAQAGDLALVKQTLGTGSITIKQNGIDIPFGKAGETYNVAASGGTLVGLYMLTGDETVPAGNYAIESDFRAVLGGLGGYDFTMPNEAVTIVAVFDGYVPTEISIWPHIIEGTDEASLEAAEWIDYEIAPLTSFTEEITLPGEVMESFITVGGERYDFAGFIMSEYDEATDTFSYSLVETLTIAAEPAQGTAEWDEWYTPISDGLMAAYMLHTHSYSTATCSTPATCSCGATTGGVDSTNHTGGTEVRNQKDATESAEGYTGDTYCLGCNQMIEQGEVIGATHTHSYTPTYDSENHWDECSCGDKQNEAKHAYSSDTDTTCDCGYNRSLFVTNDDGKDFFEVGFIPGDSVTLADDAELVVEEHYPGLAPIASTIVKKTSLGDLRCPEEYDILTDEDTVGIYGIECKLYETIMISGREYILLGSSQDGPVLIRFPDGRGMVYSIRTGRFTDYPDSSFDRTVEKPTNTTVTIDGVTYDVAYIVNNSTYILYRDGQLAGMYPSTDAAADLHGSVQFYEGYDPETLKAQQDDSDLGSVTIPADYNNAAIADFAPGKTYKVSVIGANDISVEGYDDALLNSITEDTPEIAAAKAELERLKADRDAKRAALDQLDVNNPDHMEAWAAWHEAVEAYEDALAALTGNQQATVSQTFKIPDALVGVKNVKYVAVHDTNPYAAQLAEAEQAANSHLRGSTDDPDSIEYYHTIQALYDKWEEENDSGVEFGTVTLSLDGLTLTATHTAVKGFSPFIVYAFVEADEPVYKEITTQTSRPSSSGGGVSRYTIKFDTDGGTAIANKTVTRNSKLAEPEAPTKDGYSFIGWFTDEELTTAYDFDGKVTKGFTLYAKWAKHDDEQPPAFENPFTDVKVDDWYYKDVEYAVQNGLFNGTTETTFAPNEIITRAMMVTVLYRAEGEPATNRSIPFADVDLSAYYANAVIWAKQNNIVKGVSETEFAPDQNITREQIAAIMHRYAQYKGYDVSVGENTNILSYTDFDSISEYAIASMQYAVGSGILRGKTETTLSPLDNATRAEIATILHRFIEANK